MQTAAQLPVLPVVSENTTFYMSVQPSTQVGGKTSYEFAATSLTFNPSTNVVTMNVLSTLTLNAFTLNAVTLNAVTMNVTSNLYTGSINISTGSNVFVGTTRVESQIPHPFLLSFL